MDCMCLAFESLHVRCKRAPLARHSHGPLARNALRSASRVASLLAAIELPLSPHFECVLRSPEKLQMASLNFKPRDDRRLPSHQGEMLRVLSRSRRRTVLGSKPTALKRDTSAGVGAPLSCRRVSSQQMLPAAASYAHALAGAPRVNVAADRGPNEWSDMP